MNIEEMRRRRAQLLSEAEGFRSGDGFKDDQARASFDAKMGEVETLDRQIADAVRAAAAGPGDAAAAAAEATTRERERCTGIRTAVRAAKLGDDVADKLIADGVTLDAARATVIERMATAADATRTDGNLGIQMGEDVKDKRIRGAMASIVQRAGLGDLLVRAAKARGEEAPELNPGEFRGMSLVDLARDFLETAGQKTRGFDRLTMIGRAFTYRSVTQSTSDFATLLENTMHKMLQAEYALAEDTHSKWCGRRSNVDFRAHNVYRFGMFGGLDSLTETGEFKNKAILDGDKATITLATKGNIINMSRQMIVNDDLEAFTRLPRMLGRAAKLSEEIAAYAELALGSNLGPVVGGVTLFHATHSNIGTGAAISVASIDADRVLMARQTEPNGNEYLNIKPAVLLVATELEGTAKVINGSAFDPDTANKLQRANMVYGLFREIVASPRLSGNRRYMFADPNTVPCFVKAYLDGQAEPVLETKDGWEQDGASMRVRHDFAIAGVDWRGGVTNAGQ